MNGLQNQQGLCRDGWLVVEQIPEEFQGERGNFYRECT